MFRPPSVTNVACVVALPLASAARSSGTRAVKSDETMSAPLSPYLRPSPVTFPVICSSGRLPVTVASTFAIPASGWFTTLPMRSRLGLSAWIVRFDCPLSVSASVPLA